MKIYEKLDTTAKISDNSEIICIGAFDGVHFCLLYTSDAADES